MAKFKKQVIKIMALVGAACFAGGFFMHSFEDASNSVSSKADSLVTKMNANVDANTEAYFNSDVVYKLPETVSQNDNISVIVSMKTETVMDAYEASGSRKTLSEYVNSNEGRKKASQISSKSDVLINKLKKSGVNYVLGERYDTVLSGFEVTIKANDFEKVSDLFSTDASLIVGEVYAPAETQQIVTNEVDVYDTGIFDSSSSEYQGDGVVVAVLDTGLDYTHTAFSVDNFTTTTEAFTLQNVSQKVKQTVAAQFTAGLTGEDVYVNRKVPFAYDYADKDPDVLPINSEHGTHVAGIIAGNDDTITGVAPNAQLAIMKVFSDTADGAKDSWILSAIEDCVALGVDVINMSLGSSCGFSREVDKENKNAIYDSVRDAGISLIAAASNDYNATFSSEKNGSNGLTSNPDSGTVGAPSTYEAALSVASVDGVKTPYLVYEDQIIYFNEASTADSKKKDFVDDILNTLGDDVQSHEFEYVTIPGLGESADYPEEGDFYHGKIVLVKRGITTFEDKVRIALKEKGAAGIIIYNNVSGTISMSVGANIGAVCSISQDEGEMLAKAGTGTIKISREQVAGPFMSDFSSWGPTSDLKIKPEITAHGGEIYSAVPGQAYDRLSGTSMAAPNQAGAAALIRQYVKYSGVFGDNVSPQEVTSLVNQLMMSNTDIIYNKNGLPFAVRKQGAGLVNITKATTSAGYISTYDENGEEMDKTKLELGDDKEKTGVYTMTFAINNISKGNTTYAIDSIMQTEGVSTTYTSHGDTTVTMEGYLLSGTHTRVVSVSGGTQNGNAVTVNAGSVATVTVEVVLSDADKQYMDASFAHGMYVEGFITLDATEGTSIDMSVPVLAFYGDWTEAPIFDEEYYDTNKDEIDAGLDAEDKLMADAYATRVIGGLYSDYISTLGTYYFQQDPAATQIAADKKYIAISNQVNKNNFTVNEVEYIWAGLLRNVKEVNISIVEDATGKEVFNRTNYNQAKSRSAGGTIYQSSIDVEFSALEQNLKNNTQYTVTVTSYIDYGEKEDQKNVRNVFEFPLYIDFEAPVITNVEYRTEYDRVTKKTKLYADLNVYDNHYAMGVQLGQIVPSEDPEYTFSMNTFGKYITPVYSSFNSTSKVTIELTDYVAQIKNSIGAEYDENGELVVVEHNNSFIAMCYDYAMNSATYEIRLPDEILAMNFTEEEIRLNPYETKDISGVLEIFPGESWIQVLDFETTDDEIVDIVNQTLIAKKSGEVTLTAIGYDANGNKITASTKVKVLGEGDEGYYGGYTPPEVSKFTLTGYKTNKAYYSVSNDEREIGVTGGVYSFGSSNSLSMFPSESVTLSYALDSYFPEKTSITYSVGNSNIATVTQDGTIVAQAEGSTIVTVDVFFEGKPTPYSARVSIKVKDPFTTSAIYLMSYKGLGGEVIIPDDRGITTIYSFAFTGYEYVDKDLDAGDVIDEEDPYLIKQWYIGENTITKVVIPEGVTHINSYAFTNLTALEEVVLPSTLKTIGLGAFMGCNKLKTINLENVKFINEKAFMGCALEEMDLRSVVAIGNYTFANCKLNYVELPESSQSLGIGAFSNNKYLASVGFEASKIKIGANAFEGCEQLNTIDINAAVIASRAFYGCEALTTVNLGKDVSVIGEYAFTRTNVTTFTVHSANRTLRTEENGALVYKGDELIMAAPTYAGKNNTLTTDAAAIASGAFAGNKKIFRVIANNVTNVGSYAFAECTNLQSVEMNSLAVIGDYAFRKTNLKQTPKLDNVTTIGAYAFAETKLTSVKVADNTTIGTYAFAYNAETLQSVELGNGVNVGAYAFYNPTNGYTYEETSSFSYYDPVPYIVYDETGKEVKTYTYYYYNFDKAGSLNRLNNVTVGSDVSIGDHAFEGNANLATLEIGAGSTLGAYAFYNARGLKEVDLSGVMSVGAYAFSGKAEYVFCLENNAWQFAYEREYVNGKEVIVDYLYTHSAPSITEAHLQNATYIGEYAFAYNDALETLVLGEALTSIEANAFMDCVSITSIDIPVQIASIGDYAFYGTSVSVADLSNVDTVGKYAFARTLLEEVALKADAEILDGAFAYCEELAIVENLSAVKSIGANAFRETAIETADLTNAVYVGEFAFADSNVNTVVFGDKLTELGANPFTGCNVATFAREAEIIFNGKPIGKEVVTTYDVSETVKLIDDVLYQIVPNGMELICYPMLKAGESYTVEEGTVKISARAFAGASLENVTLASTLLAIGDKAFYGCNELSVVIFQSYEAPVLEEEYDLSYIALENLPFTGKLSSYEGLGITQFYMWNATSNYNNFYFGANFVDFIGHLNNKLVMVKPANGQHYDTFIFEQYFATIVNGHNALMDETISVISLINALPSSITLANEADVVNARLAYEALPSLDQQALVSNYSKLTSAEATIAYLKLNQNPVQPPDSSSDEQSSDIVLFNGGWIVFAVIGVVVVGCGVCAVVLFLLKKKKSVAVVDADAAEAVQAVEETKSEEADEQTAEDQIALDENKEQENNAEE